MPAQLYFGVPGSEYWSTPHPVDFCSPAIAIDDEEIDQSQYNPIAVTLHNHGNEAVTDAIVRLYWVDPATAYLPNRCCRIKEWAAGTVPANSDVLGVGTPLVQTYTWKPNICLLGTNNGAVALVAQAYSLDKAQFPAGFAESDPLTAIRNVHVVDASAVAQQQIQRSRSSPTREYDSSDHFAFAATNTTNKTIHTEVIARSITSSDAPRARLLESALTSPKLRKAMNKRHPDVVEAKSIHLHLGIERVMARYFDTGRPGIDEYVFQGSRIGHTGPLTEEAFDRILFKSKEETPLDFELRPFESRQVILGIVPKGKRGDLNVIEVVHQTKARKPVPLGRLVVVFVVGRGFER